MQETSTTQYTKPIPKKKNVMSKCKKQNNRMQSIGKYTNQFFFSENTSNV